jgi:branched-subunit amino acid ABC-type transport system permease component
VIEFLAAVVAALVGGVGIGGVAAAVSVRLRLWGQLDLVPAVAAAGVALGARELDGLSRAGAVADGVLLVPVAGMVGYLVALFLGDRLRFRTDPAQALPVAVAVALVGDQFLRARTDPVAATLIEGAEAMLTLRTTPLLTTTMVATTAVVALVTSAASLWLGVGRTGRLLRAWIADPEVPLLFGLDATRLGAKLAGMTAALGAAGGLAYAAVTPVSAASAFEIFVAAGAALLMGGTRSIPRVIIAAVVLAVLAAAGNEIAEGWGTVAAYGLALGFALWRALRSPAAAPVEAVAT